MTIGVPTVNAMLDIALGGSRWLNVTTDVGVEACPRQVVTYAAAINGQKKNTSTHFFQLTQAATISRFAVYDSASAGNLVWIGDFNREVPGGVGDAISVAPNALTYSIS